MGGGQPDTHTVELAGAILPVLLGVLTIIPVYVVGASVFDKKTGLAGAFALRFCLPMFSYPVWHG
jgi:dolichyl-diphosphooligosaccharide--protein glycosyltransferase